MEYENIKKNWEKTYQNTLKNIEKKLKSTRDYDKELSELCNWLITNELNLDITTGEFWGYLDDPFKTEYLFDMLDHAMVDDGTVIFVRVKIEDTVERVFLTFGEYNTEEEFRKMCLRENEMLVNSMINARNSMVDFFERLKSEHPEKAEKLTQRKRITEDDFIFEVYQDSKLFMKECEELKAQRVAKSNKHAEIIKNLKVRNL